MKTQHDSVYSQPRQHVVDFAFDAQVAAVFPDMIRRSVPGYDAVLSLTGVLAEHYAQPNSRLYDLGCSLGAFSLSMRQRVQSENTTLVAVDNSQTMLAQCEKNLSQLQKPEQLPIEYRCEDIQDTPIQSASVVLLAFTLQFIPLAQRQALLTKIYSGLLPGGVLILAEKLEAETAIRESLLGDLHLAFKRANGYSELEISQKRSALENVLVPESAEMHQQRLRAVGFSQVEQWFQCLNFSAFLAVK